MDPEDPDTHPDGRLVTRGLVVRKPCIDFLKERHGALPYKSVKSRRLVGAHGVVGRARFEAGQTLRAVSQVEGDGFTKILDHAAGATYRFGIQRGWHVVA